jgi:hypothetical protein
MVFRFVVGAKIKINEVPYTIAKKVKLTKTSFTLERPYDGPSSTDATIAFLPEPDDEEEGSVLQQKLERLAMLIGKLGTLVASIIVLILLSRFFIKLVIEQRPWKNDYWVSLLIASFSMCFFFLLILMRTVICFNNVILLFR